MYSLSHGILESGMECIQSFLPLYIVQLHYEIARMHDIHLPLI